MTSCGSVFNSSCRNIIDYRDNLATISQNIVMMFFRLSHRPTRKYPGSVEYTVGGCSSSRHKHALVSIRIELALVRIAKSS